MTTIKQGLEKLSLSDNYTMYINTVLYDWINDKVNIEVIFQEGEYKHSRSFTYDAINGMTESHILNLINKEIWYKL